MAQKLTDTQIEQMFAAYCETPTVQYVARKCHRSPKTVRHWRDKNKWDNRLATVRTKAQARMDSTLAARYAQNMSLLDAAKSTYARCLVKHTKFDCQFCGRENTVPIPGVRASLRDVGTLIDVDAKMHGGYHPVDQRGRYDHMTDEQLRAELDRIRKLAKLLDGQ